MALQLITNKIGTCGDLLNNFIATLFHRILSNLLKLLAFKNTVAVNIGYGSCVYASTCMELELWSPLSVEL